MLLHKLILKWFSIADNIILYVGVSSCEVVVPSILERNLSKSKEQPVVKKWFVWYTL